MSCDTMTEVHCDIHQAALCCKIFPRETKEVIKSVILTMGSN